MATANASDQILQDLLGPEGYNEWFSGDILAGDENVLTAAAPSSSKDSLELENVCEMGPFSLEGY